MVLNTVICNVCSITNIINSRLSLIRSQQEKNCFWSELEKDGIHHHTILLKNNKNK